MKHLGIDVNVKQLPELDPNYIPLFPFYVARKEDFVHLKKASKKPRLHRPGLPPPWISLQAC